MAVSALLDRVYAHLQDVLKDPTKALDENLLQSIDRQVTGSKGRLPLE